MNIFAVCHPQVLGEYTTKYHIPILPNVQGQTVLHLCNINKDYKTLDTILKYLQLYGIDHHSRAIKDLIPTFIQKNLPEFLTYLDSRVLQTQQLSDITKGCLKEDSTGIIDSQLWFKMKDFDGKLFRHKPVENRIKCEFIDLPIIYHFNDEHFQDMFDELTETDDFELFTKIPIQKVIEFNYGLVKEYTVKKLFIPFVVFQCLYVTFTNYIFAYSNSSSLSMTIEYVFLATLAMFATYFITNEARQLKRDGLGHLLSIWNYIDIIPPIGIYLVVLVQIFVSAFDTSTIRTILSITSFFMWFKFLYFLRIFNKTGYLIRMILKVMYDMRPFLLVLLITTIAFADSLLCISLANEEGDNQFVKSFPDALIYTYLLILGEFNVDDFGEVAVLLVWGLFLLCTIFNMIVMLNLLISIISETFANVTANAQNAAFQEMASMIAENNYLVPDWETERYAKMNCMLLIVTDLEGNKDQFRDPVLERIHDLKYEFDSQVTELGKMFNRSLKMELGSIQEQVANTDTQMKNLQRSQTATQDCVNELCASNRAEFANLLKQLKGKLSDGMSLEDSVVEERSQEKKLPSQTETASQRAKKGFGTVKQALAKKTAVQQFAGKKLNRNQLEDDLE